MKATATFTSPLGSPVHLDVVESAVRDGFARPTRWSVTAVHGITALPIAAGSGDDENLAITTCEIADYGTPDGTHPYGGIARDERRLPPDVAYAVERELRRIWDADADPDKPRLLAMGFTTRPTLMWPSSGRPPPPPAMIAVQVRRRYETPAHRTRSCSPRPARKDLRRKPDAREFTSGGKAILDLVDAAKVALRDADDDALLPFPAEVAAAAMQDIEGDGT